MYVPGSFLDLFMRKLNLQVGVKNNMFFLDVCGSLHLSLGTVIYEITNKWALLLEGRICAFLRGEREFGRLLSSQWIKVLFPLQWLITTTENEGERGRDGGRESEIKGDRDLGGRQLTPLMVGLLCTLASHFRSKAHTEHSSIKHSSQQGRLDVLSVSVHPNGL